MTMEDELLIVAECDVRSAIEAVTVLSNLVAPIGEHEAVVAAHWLRFGHSQPLYTVAQFQGTG